MFAKVLVDNITKNELLPEWGLSIWITYRGHEILLDTGATEKFARNAAAMGLDLQQIEVGVLSHAHYDHANGLDVFFDRNKTTKFYLGRHCRENCYGKRWIFSKYIGIRKGYLNQYQDRICYVDGVQTLMPGVTLVPHSTPNLEVRGRKAKLYVRKDGSLRPDNFDHEQSLVLETERGLVVFSSCSHGGIDNILREVTAAVPNQKLYALIGGLHLYHSSEEVVRAIAAQLKALGTMQIYTGHCTGDCAFRILQEELGESAVKQLYTGMELVL